MVCCKEIEILNIIWILKPCMNNVQVFGLNLWMIGVRGWFSWLKFLQFKKYMIILLLFGYQKKRLFPEKNIRAIHPDALTGENTQILLVTGIASPRPMLEEVQRYTRQVTLMDFDDHHEFSAGDLRLIGQKFARLGAKNRFILTTEKDAARLKDHPALPSELKPHIHVLPIEVDFLLNQKDIFNQNILKYVRTHSRNCSLP